MYTCSEDGSVKLHDFRQNSMYVLIYLIQILDPGNLVMEKNP